MITYSNKRVFAQNIAKEILDEWILAGKSRNFEEMVKSVPEINDFSLLFEIAFLSSLEKEEGSPILFRLVYFPNATNENLQKHAKWIDAFPFSESIPLTPNNIAKLALAFDQNSTALAVVKKSRW